MPSQEIAYQPLSWDELNKFSREENDLINGPTNSYSTLRLFGQPIEAAKVILYRDNHAWCPYCQKVWLWLEWKKIPYKIKKVTMRCYGEKESWYLKKVRSGLLPAIEIDNNLITESDQILLALEKKFGSLGRPLEDSKSLKLRNLERRLFRAWCMWLCRPSINQFQENISRDRFKNIANELEKLLLNSDQKWLDPANNDLGNNIPGSNDIIFIPYLERMNASLAYYKGFILREEYPGINQWFNYLEELEVYRGTQSDFHTHVYDLPPQMGGCWKYSNENQREISEAIDCGEGLGAYETSFQDKKINSVDESITIAISRVIKHRTKLLHINPLGKDMFDEPLRTALTNMVLSEKNKPKKESAIGLRYLKDRISVPRDMPLLSARNLRRSLELTAALDSEKTGIPISSANRFDQDPTPFK